MDVIEFQFGFCYTEYNIAKKPKSQIPHFSFLSPRQRRIVRGRGGEGGGAFIN